ncbi:MAG: hypothetical protein JWO67_7402 [Streptosporangiaceae bacterium]|nr:hypothetical protein [Streptosporangiaceae bacterium]
MIEEIRCSHNHRLVRYEPTGCDAGHEHRQYRCPMRVGSRRCGEVMTVPRMSAACSRSSA